jgi:hypothetical protein
MQEEIQKVEKLAKEELNKVQDTVNYINIHSG